MANPPYGREKRRRGSAFGAMPEAERADENLIEGKNAVAEALRSGREIDKILFSAASLKTVGHIVAEARRLGITAQECDRRKLDKLSATGAHQGVIAMCAAADYKTLDDVLALAESRGEPPLIVLCDCITDPHNLGAIIRTAEVVGAHGVMIPKRRSAGLNAACAKAAAGALEHVPVVKCQSTLAAVQELKERGVFVFAADMGGQSMYGTDMTGACALVIGSEGEGISAGVRKEADFTVSIPQKGKIPSLNASNAAAVLLYEIYRQRNV